MFPGHLQFWSGDLWRGYASRRAISGCCKAFFSTAVRNSIGLLLFPLVRTNVTSQSCCISYLFFTLYNGFTTMLSSTAIFLKYVFEPRVQKQTMCRLSYHRGRKAKQGLLTVHCWQGPIQIIVFRKSFRHHKNVSSGDKKIPDSF